MNELAQLEALLFVAGNEGVSLDTLAHILEMPTAKVFDSLTQLETKYFEDSSCALHLMETAEHFFLTTKKEYAPLIKQFAQSPNAGHLSQAAIETLAIIAYKQPITRAEIDEIRGVQSAGSVQKLTIRRLIEAKGRVDGPGRAILYGTTTYFMDYFGLKTLSDLPSVADMEVQFEEELPTDLFFDHFKQQFAELEDSEKQEEN